MTVELVPLEGLPEITAGDDLADLLAPALREAGVTEDDVVVITSKIVSKAEGRLVPGTDRTGAVARETVRVVARRDDLVIAETRHGFVCANAGVDASNLAEGVLALLPEDPDGSADRLRLALSSTLGIERLGVVITDTFGRAWRTGVVNVAIGCAGLPAAVDLRGTTDHHGQVLEATVVAYADEIAAASGLVMAKDARVPAAIVRGLVSPDAPDGRAADMIRPADEDLFRTSPLEALRAAQEATAFDPGEIGRPVLEEAVAAALVGAPAELPLGLRIVVVTSNGGRAALGAALPEAPPGASAWLVVSAERAAEPADLGAITERLRLALAAQGLGVASPVVAEETNEAVRDVIGGEPGLTIAGVMACGRTSGDGGGAIHPQVDPTSLTAWR